MENKQTAINYFEEQLWTIQNLVSRGKISLYQFDELFRKYLDESKEMEKAQIINAYANGVVNEISIYNTITGEEFYNNTYGSI